MPKHYAILESDKLPVAEEYFHTDLGKIPASISNPQSFRELFSEIAEFYKKQYLSAVPPHLGWRLG